jgi:hypothetical protein
VKLLLLLLFLHLSTCNSPLLPILLSISLFTTLKFLKNVAQIGSFPVLMSQWDSNNFSLNRIRSHHRGYCLLIYAGMGSIHRLAVQLGLFSNLKMAIYGENFVGQHVGNSLRYGMVVMVGRVRAGKKLKSCNLIGHQTYNLESFLCN